MTDKNELNAVPAVALTREELENRDPDAPVFAARTESQIANGAAPVTITLPQGVWSAIIPGIFNLLAEGAQSIQIGKVAKTLGLNDDPDLAEKLREDNDLSQLLLFGLQTLANAETPDRFFNVDFNQALTDISEQLDLPAVDAQDVAAILSPENLRKRFDRRDAGQREKQNEAKGVVSDLLRTFAQDTDSNGKTLN